MKVNEWLQALDDAKKVDSDGCTAHEIAKIWNLSIKSARARLTQMHHEGLIHMCGRKTITTIDGRQQTVPAYKLTQMPKGKRGA
jgi:hypothetical protein